MNSGTYMYVSQNIGCSTNEVVSTQMQKADAFSLLNLATNTKFYKTLEILCNKDLKTNIVKT